MLNNVKRKEQRLHGKFTEQAAADATPADPARAAAEKQRAEAALKTIAVDPSDLKNREIIFFINYTAHNKDLKKASIETVKSVNSIVKASKVKLAKVTGRYWGETNKVTPINLASEVQNPIPNKGNFILAANEILAATTFDKDKVKNYIFISTGNIADSVAQSAAILQEAAKLNPKSTFDFVVASTGHTKVDELVEQLKKAGLGNRVNVLKVKKAAEVDKLVKRVITARGVNSYVRPASEAGRHWKQEADKTPKAENEQTANVATPAPEVESTGGRHRKPDPENQAVENEQIAHVATPVPEVESTGGRHRKPEADENQTANFATPTSQVESIGGRHRKPEADENQIANFATTEPEVESTGGRHRKPDSDENQKAENDQTSNAGTSVTEEAKPAKQKKWIRRVLHR